MAPRSAETWLHHLLLDPSLHALYSVLTNSLMCGVGCCVGDVLSGEMNPSVVDGNEVGIDLGDGLW